MIFPVEWMDKYGFVAPQPITSDKPCDNGVLYTSVAVLSGYEFPDYKMKIESCYLDNGLIARWPGNNFDQSAWDDYLGVAAASIKMGITSVPRDVFWYGVKHAGVYNTDGKLTWNDFLWRNFPVWPLMFAAAYPKFKAVSFPLLWLVQKFFKDPRFLLSINDTSGLQLQWVYLEGCRLLGYTFDSWYLHDDVIEEAKLVYYHKYHPFNN